jgi:hypothetical protein
MIDFGLFELFAWLEASLRAEEKRFQFRYGDRWSLEC